MGLRPAANTKGRVPLKSTDLHLFMVAEDLVLNYLGLDMGDWGGGGEKRCRVMHGGHLHLVGKVRQVSTVVGFSEDSKERWSLRATGIFPALRSCLAPERLPSLVLRFLFSMFTRLSRSEYKAWKPS